LKDRSIFLILAVIFAGLLLAGILSDDIGGIFTSGGFL
jgi:hypothetical protein